MAATPKLGLNLPLGTLKATHNATGSTTTQFHTTNADAADVSVGDIIRVYNVAANIRAFIGETTVSNKQTDTPGAGVTRLTLSPALNTIPLTNAEAYSPGVVDVENDLNDQMLIIDGAMDAMLCTTSTRPPSPFVGQIIMESTVLGVAPFDLRYWDGSTWVLIVSTGLGVAGRVAYASSNTASAFIDLGVTIGPYLSVTFNAFLGYTYLIDVSCTVETQDGTFGSSFSRADIKKASGGSVSESGAIIGSYDMSPFQNNSLSQNPVSFKFPWVADVNGQVTLGLFLTYYAARGSSNRVRFTPNSYNVMAVEEAGVL